MSFLILTSQIIFHLLFCIMNILNHVWLCYTYSCVCYALVAALAVRIQSLQTHLKKHRKDNPSKRGLEAMMTKQRKLLIVWHHIHVTLFVQLFSMIIVFFWLDISIIYYYLSYHMSSLSFVYTVFEKKGFRYVSYDDYFIEP